MISSANLILSFLTVAAQILLLIVFLLAIFSFGFYSKIAEKYLRNSRAIALAFLVALVATCGSLFYSQVAVFVPCELCWMQRIFMYPQVILLGLSLIKKEEHIIDYSLALATVGIAISLYHNMLIYGATSETSCSLSGISCAVKFVIGFDYITIPLMSLTAFAVIILLLLSQKIAKKI